MIASQFNSEVSKKELCIMILMHEYPLSMVDHLYFKRFCCSLQPLFKVPTRNTLKNDILVMYRVQRAKSQRDLNQNKGRIAITTDMWTATNQKRCYMAITAHYIDDDPWTLRGHLIRFLYVHAPHTAERSSKFDILNWWSVNGTKYPTLQQIARDFVAVPITSVASESALSAGGRLLDPHRSRLHHSTVEAMMCARSWIHDEMKGVSEKEKMELEGVFSALVMEDTRVEEQTENTQTDADKEDDARLEE
ncbi:Putative AC transposase [Linum grandiflorum]